MIDRFGRAAIALDAASFVTAAADTRITHMR